MLNFNEGGAWRRRARRVSSAAGVPAGLLQVGQQAREVQYLAGGAQGCLQVHLRLRFVGHHGGQIGTHQLVLLGAQVDLFLVEEVLGTLQLAETVAVRDALGGDLREGLLDLGIGGGDPVAATAQRFRSVLAQR